MKAPKVPEPGAAYIVEYFECGMWMVDRGYGRREDARDRVRAIRAGEVVEHSCFRTARWRKYEPVTPKPRRRAKR